jgi:hypothetical protein
MTKDEIKLVKEQQAEREKGYKNQIRLLEENKQLYVKDISRLENEKAQLLEENRLLKEQIAHLQSGLTGEERDYYL